MSERLKFRKMHGLGNDFMVVDATRQAFDLAPERIRALADRHRGIGFDQLLVIEPAPEGGLDYRIFNADGSGAEQCGNGMRCLARYAFDVGYADSDSIRFGQGRAQVEARRAAGEAIAVDMGPPRLAPADIPFRADKQAASYTLSVNGLELTIGAVSMGNPHAVVKVDDIDNAPVAELGPAIEQHPDFPNRTNVGFMEVTDPAHIRLRVWERGTGETLACGSGACAAVVWGRLMGWLGDDPVTVELPGGQLEIRWPGGDAPVWMSGPAETVYEGELIEN